MHCVHEQISRREEITQTDLLQGLQTFTVPSSERL